MLQRGGIFLTLYCLFSLTCLAENITIVLSIDGFSQQYLSRFQPKNLNNIASKGIQADGLIPVFPTKTFPNHVSIATGQYPAKHGIFHNRFYRSDLGKFYSPGAEINDPRWLLSTPIWTLAEQQNINTAIYFWPTSEAQINNIQPKYFVPFNEKIPNSQRIDQINKWLDLPSNKRPRLILAYLSEVDTAGHLTGIRSDVTEQAVLSVDEQIGRLYKKIQTLSFGVNLIILSDHGMIELNENNEIPTDAIISKIQNKYPQELVIVNGETQLLIYSENKRVLNELQIELTAYQYKNPEKFRIFDKHSYPAYWHITDKSSPISPSMIVEANPPFTFKYKINDENKLTIKNKGTHGYEPKHQDLLGIFIAIGPDFKSEIKLDRFENIHVFPLLKKLININEQIYLDDKQQPDGNLNVLLPILTK